MVFSDQKFDCVTESNERHRYLVHETVPQKAILRAVLKVRTQNESPPRLAAGTQRPLDVPYLRIICSRKFLQSNKLLLFQGRDNGNGSPSPTDPRGENSEAMKP